METGKDSGYQLIRAFATWIILIHHLSATASILGIARPSFLQMADTYLRGELGAVAVGLFFLLSGALLHRNHRDIEDTKAFITYRFLRLLFPLWIASAPLLILDSGAGLFIHASQSGRRTAPLNLLGLDFYYWVFTGKIPYFVCGEWFTSVILTLYLIYPLLNRAFRDRRSRTTATVLIVLLWAVNMKFGFLSAGSGWYSLTLGLMYFWLGMWFDELRSLFCGKKAVCAALAEITVILLFFPRQIGGVIYLPSLIVSVCLFVLLYNAGIAAGDRIISGKGSVSWTCRHSYMIYLVHHYFMYWLMPVLIGQDPGALRFCAFGILIVAVGLVYAAVMQRVSEILFPIFREKIMRTERALRNDE